MDLVSRFCRKKIWPVFERRYMTKARKRLVNDQFTLITQNCIGGVLYSFLGKRFDSPTINLYIFQKDFCKFCSDIHYYLESELRFYKNEKRTDCPHAFLGEGDRQISIQFTHYQSEEEACRKWNERKQRIHWDNLYIITNDGNGMTSEDMNILQQSKCKKMVVFTSKSKPEIPCSFPLRTLKKYDTAVFMQTERNKWTGLRPWQREFDIVSWLNDSDEEKVLEEYRIHKRRR